GRGHVLVEDRLREGAALLYPSANEGQLVGRNEPGGLDQVGDELGELVDREGRGQTGVTGSLCRAGLAGGAQLREIHTSIEVSAKRLRKLSFPGLSGRASKAD